MKPIKADSVNDLKEVAQTILENLNERTILLFRGEMGAGKTTLIREIAALRGVEDCVTSPTFALVNEYKDRDGESIFHFDLYRINSLEEAYDFGYEEYFYGGDLCLIEWPEKIESLIPEGAMTVNIEVVDDTTRIFIIE